MYDALLSSWEAHLLSLEQALDRSDIYYFLRKKANIISYAFYRVSVSKKRKPLLPVEIDHDIYRRFDERDNVFGRMMYDPDAEYYRMGMFDLVEDIIRYNVEGYTHLDAARVQGAWGVYNHFSEAFQWDELTHGNTVMDDALLPAYEIDGKERMSGLVKETAEVYGACKVGITEVNDYWLYSHDRNGNPIDIPDGFQNAIVMLVQMDKEVMKRSPSMAAGVENALTYSKMAFLMGCMAQFIRALGYKAIPMGNDTALSIPLAVQAGLGELGRNGLLITPEFGPCIKICKIFTDLPLAHDEPLVFGISEFCKTCRKCAESCEVDAISSETEPSYDIVSKCNNPGIKRWAVDVDSCYRFWIENGGDCSSCIAQCPFTDGLRL